MAMRAFIKNLIAELAPRVPGALLPSLVGRFCPIFMLHRVHAGDTGAGHPARYVERCLTLLHRHRFRPLALPELALLLAEDRPIPPKSVVFTIDDGFADHAEIAGPLFAQYEVPLTCFVITGFLDGALWPWDDQIVYVLEHTPRPGFTLALPGGEALDLALADAGARHGATHLLRERLKQLPHDHLYEWLPGLYATADVAMPDRAPAEYRPMSWDEARRFAASGHTIAPHTRSHRILSRLGDAQSRAEIVDAVDRVNTMIGGKATVFAYPTGRLQDFTPRDSGFAAAAGITCAVSTEVRNALATDAPLALPRFPLPKNSEDFVQYLSFVERLKERVRR